MTKLRTPLTFEDAMTRVAGLIGWTEVQRITGRADSTVRAWGDPNNQTAAPIDQALALDAAYVAAGGEDPPFLDTFAFRLNVRLIEQTACRSALAGELAEAMRETGDALVAGAAIVQGDASPFAAHRAIEEARQAEAALGKVLIRLTSFLPSGEGPRAGNVGGTP